jgi:hypothetical protein
MAGVTPSGPFDNVDSAYVYQFRDSTDRLRFISAFAGNAEVDLLEMGRWVRWILALAKRPVLTPRVRIQPLPSSVRQVLERFYEVPGFRELSRTKLPPFLLRHVREGLLRYANSKGLRDVRRSLPR